MDPRDADRLGLARTWPTAEGHSKLPRKVVQYIEHPDSLSQKRSNEKALMKTEDLFQKIEIL